MKRIISMGTIVAVLLLSSCSTQQLVVNQQNETITLNTTAESPTEIAEATEADELTYNDYYNQALDEEYWASIPDTPGEEFTYYKLSNDFFTHYNIDYTPGIGIESYTGNRTTVKIPKEINGYPVLSITQHVLQGDGFDEPTIKELYIPDSVIFYSDLGFGNYEKIRLPQVTSPGSDDIGYSLFIHKVKTLALYGNKNVSLFGTYDSLEELYLADGIVDLYCQENLFETSSLKAIGIPASVTKIHDDGWGELEDGKMGRLQPEINIFGSRDVTIICQEGSYAQEYAERFGLKTFIVE